MNADPFANQRKKTLLRERFTSFPYLSAVRVHFAAALHGLEDAIEWFYENPPDDDWQSWHISSRPDGWEKRAVPNFRSILQSIDYAMTEYATGNAGPMRGVSDSVSKISRGLAELGNTWLDYTEKRANNVFLKYIIPQALAIHTAGLINYSVAQYWEDDEILNERITGPISDADLRIFEYEHGDHRTGSDESDADAETLMELFQSTEYLEATIALFRESRSGLVKALAEFEKRDKPKDWENWYEDSKPDGWREFILPLMDTTINQLVEAASTPTETDRLRQGTLYAFWEYESEIRVSGWNWMLHVQEEALPVARAYLEPQAQAIQRAQNIYFTVQGLWDRYSILNPEITGYLAQHEVRDA
jgi:hypothetical protein